MLLIFHILVAIISIAIASYGVLRPSRRVLGMSYGLGLSTLASGAALSIVTHARLVSVCISGLLYLGLVSVLLVAAEYRLRTDG